MTKRYDYWRIGDGYFEIFDLPRDGRVPVAQVSCADVLLVERIVDCLNNDEQIKTICNQANKHAPVIS